MSVKNKRSPREAARQKWMTEGGAESWENYASFLRQDLPIERQAKLDSVERPTKILHIFLMAALVMGVIWFASL